MNTLESAQVVQTLKPAGVFTLKHYRDGVKIGDDIIEPNLVVTQGLDMIADVCFNNALAASTAWYLMLYGTNISPAAGWTAATFTATAGELDTEIDEANRPTWTANAANDGASSSNSDSPATFTMASGDTIYGAGIVSSNTKGGTTGVLLAATKFSTARTVLAADELQLTYTIQLTSS